MNEWIVACNLDYYDVYGAFSKFKCLDWKQDLKKVEVGDAVYIYVTVRKKKIKYADVHTIKYKCCVNQVNLPTADIDDSDYILNHDIFVGCKKYMELELIREYDAECLSLSKLRDCGLKGNIQGQRSVPGCIKPLLDSMCE